MKKLLMMPFLALLTFTSSLGQDTLKRGNSPFIEFEQFLKTNPDYNQELNDSIIGYKFNTDKASYKAEIERYNLQLKIYEFYKTNLEHLNRSYKWQFYSSILIFIIVLIIVFFGLYFAWKQFENSTLKKHNKDKKNKEKELTHLKFSLKGFKISSSVLGVIILGMSIIFFYLYLVFVYPISQREDKVGEFSYQKYIENVE
jgi:predicted PurR-regulated permease PerM